MDGSDIRNLLRQSTVASLATLDRQNGTPYVSMVEVASTPDGRPLMLLSGLARHTRNLMANARASLLVDQRMGQEPALTGLRATLIGTMQVAQKGDIAARYLARYPDAQAYADFNDFGYWVLEPSCAHAIGGFGRISELPASDILLTEPGRALLARQEVFILERVNGLATDRKLPARAVGLDLEGVDVRGPNGLTRLVLALPANDPQKATKAIFSALASMP